jgi:enoyl-[acyl-carrier protein] reductase III
MRVFVTGGSGAIGHALCKRFAAEGASVAFSWFVDHDGRDRTLGALDGRGVAIRANLAEDGAPEQVAEQVIEALGGVDVFIHNAAAGAIRPLLKLKTRHWERTLRVNTRAFMLLAQKLEPVMPDGARVMALTSQGSTGALGGYGAVGASKAALEAIVRQLALELGPRGITVNALRPGLVDTPAIAYFPDRDTMIAVALERTPLGRLTTPEDVADVAMLLASPLASMITGQVITVDGGLSALV